MSKSCDSRQAIGVLIVALTPCVIGACRAYLEPAGYEAVRTALASGRYADAERLAGASVARAEARDGRESLPLAEAIDWLIRARLKNGRAADAVTVDLATRAVRLKERRLGRSSPEAAASIHNLAVVHSQRGEFQTALRLHEEVLAIRKAALGTDDPAVAESLEELAIVLIQLERFPEAERRLADAQRIRERRSAESPIELARALELIGLLHRSSGNYSAAVAAIDQAIDIRNRVSPNHPDTVVALQVRGDVHLLLGDTASARRIWASALDLAERTLRPEHPVIADLLRKLGFAEYSLGNLAQARQLRERALRIGERSLAPCDPLAVTLINSVALSLTLDGEYAEARRRYQQARSTTEKCVGTTTAAYATFVFNEGELAATMGDRQEADRLYSLAIDIWSRGLGPDHPFVARGLDALAEVAASLGQRRRARDLYERALVSRQRSLGEGHPHVAWTLTNLAKLLAESGELTTALHHVDRAIAIYEKSGPSDEPDHFARALELRGSVEARRGNLMSARTSLQQGLSARIRVFGEDHPLVAELRATLATVDLGLGNSQAALGAALEAERSGREHLLFTVRYLPERQAMAYAAKRPRGLDLALTIAAAGSLPNQAPVFDAVIRSRGVVLDELAARPRLITSSDPAVASLVSAVTTSRQRFANLLVRSLQEPVSRALLDEARSQKEDAERSLAEHSVETRTELRRVSAGVDDIRGAIPPNAALVAFVSYERTPTFGPSQQTGASPRELSYGAFVMKSRSRDVVLVRLGTATRLEALVKRWHSEASGHSIGANSSRSRAQRTYDEASTRLRQAVWDPLIPHLGGAARIFVVPDGLINLVNFAALPDSEGRFLLEREPVIHYLTTERDLLSRSEARPGQTLLAVGGPAFDEVSQASETTSVKRGSECLSLSQVHFESLPGSLSEVSEIGALWPSSGSDVKLLRGAAATESAVKQAVTGRRIVHLATHGFFLGADCTFGRAGLRAVGGLATASAVSVVNENPLLLTGLAFAGANHWKKAALDQDDGLLTAEEIAGLNLQGTEWAVLSACATGLGEIKAGEGVFGLRRAFQIAGARTIIMSLWSVEDESTREWMRALYDARLQRRLDTAAAVRDAGLTVLRARRAKGQSTHPFYWAAFVAAGDWK